MALEAVVSFWQKVNDDRSLLNRISPMMPELRKGAAPSQFEGLSRIARDAGYDCAPDELHAAEEVSRFWYRVRDDVELQKKLIPADAMENREAANFIGRVASQVGFKFTIEQLDVFTKAQAMAADAGKGELSADELAGVVGGAAIQGPGGSALDAFATGGAGAGNQMIINYYSNYYARPVTLASP